jgi:hypothetical protein
VLHIWGWKISITAFCDHLILCVCSIPGFVSSESVCVFRIRGWFHFSIFLIFFHVPFSCCAVFPPRSSMAVEPQLYTGATSDFPPSHIVKSTHIRIKILPILPIVSLSFSIHISTSPHLPRYYNSYSSPKTVNPPVYY